MISFIVPTLWKSDKIHDTIKSFINADIPNSEFIVVNNEPSIKYESPHPSVIVLEQNQNIFVNPAWNLGVKVSKNDLVCIINDDITINVNTIKTNLETLIHMTDETIIGFDANRNFDESLNENLEILNFEIATCRSLGFGCMLILKKHNYIEIPEGLDIFFGDDLLYWFNKDYRQKIVYNISNLKAMGGLSITSRDYENVMQTEVKVFDQVITSIQQNNYVYKTNF